MANTIELIQQINQKLEQFKSSIDNLIQQNNIFIQNVRKYENKNYILQDIVDETLEQRKERGETMLDQLDEMVKRDDLGLENIQTFEQKMVELTETINQLKMNFNVDKVYRKTKSDDIRKKIIDIIDTMKKQSDDHFNNMKSQYVFETIQNTTNETNVNNNNNNNDNKTPNVKMIHGFTEEEWNSKSKHEQKRIIRSERKKRRHRKEKNIKKMFQIKNILPLK